MKRSLIFLALALSAGLALAETATVSGKHDGEHGDRHAKAEARFNEVDSNHDGKLSFAEMQAAEQQRLKERFDRLDADHDGGVSLAEMRQAHEHRGDMREHRHEHWQEMHEKLQALDTNHDQALTKQEIGDAFPRLTENFDRLDANHDGKLTREEMHAMHRMHHDDDQQMAPPANR
jgi:Ca2+-binding EF-hand superfamily protein